MSPNKIPNILTLIRIALIPILVTSFYLEGNAARYVATGIFIFASITDYFDGLLARLWKTETSFGRMLDPIADKMLVISTLVMLVHKNMAPVLPILAILWREILVSGLREYLGQIKVSMPVSSLSKVKTVMQMISIIVVLLGEESTGIHYLTPLGHTLLWVTAALTLFTGYIYFKEGWQHL
ncbi:MAG: CDP-diacylglycerol--glycerol-3-phosphate 3-phosphatidyltransferase [Candidatus Midichloria sp.]|uniref:cardiolipin synthase (CMP-forming) n=1 Tax=Hyalomma marginatum TaxID=34627 RepID=A0A8S4C2J0_9ACAR|nr:CDP-diacylglycerol--glycerol-3-phosphate 3-phosphatidyltransferase [Hyalomma marginatum]CAG7594390.1 CDP-diacylglycerol--glycerol-3-phosphate 3-phosphatidyltransferase [Hyalomma marginatum]